jgi:hypothetical protein
LAPTLLQDLVGFGVHPPYQHPSDKNLPSEAEIHHPLWGDSPEIFNFKN